MKRQLVMSIFFVMSVYQSSRNNCLFPALLSVVGFVDPDIIEIAHFFGSYQNRHILQKLEENRTCSQHGQVLNESTEQVWSLNLSDDMGM